MQYTEWAVRKITLKLIIASILSLPNYIATNKLKPRIQLDLCKEK